MAEKSLQNTESGTSNSEQSTGKPLYRSVSNRMLAGVCGGVADYFGIDAVLVRCIWGGLVLFGGLGVLPYILAWIIVPENPHASSTTDKTEPNKSNATLILGGAMICIGLWFLFDRFHWFEYYPFHFRWNLEPYWLMDLRLETILPGLILLLGVLYLIKSFRKDEQNEAQPGGSIMEKKLTRSVSDKMIAGVCGGIAVYFNIDASLVRIGFALLTLAGGGFIGIVAYVVMMVVVPEETVADISVEKRTETADKTTPAKPQAQPKKSKTSKSGSSGKK